MWRIVSCQHIFKRIGSRRVSREEYGANSRGATKLIFQKSPNMRLLAWRAEVDMVGSEEGTNKE
jgi:hypothetical protein